MKGIVLAGGLGTRLRPLTTVVSKQLLPVYDKPMIYYPIATLMDSGITEISIISSPTSILYFEELLGSGKRFGVDFTYIIQRAPKGIAESFILSEKFIGKDDVTLILGDNIFHGQSSLGKCLRRDGPGCSLFGYQVSDPSKYGVAAFDKLGNLEHIKEKPNDFISDIAITGLYSYDNTVVERAKSLTPSHRNELEITDLNNTYIEENLCSLYIIGGAWLDMGSADGLLQASNYVQTIEDRQGMKIACLEEIAFRNGMIGEKELLEAIKFHNGTKYGKHLQKVCDGKDLGNRR